MQLSRAAYVRYEKAAGNLVPIVDMSRAWGNSDERKRLSVELSEVCLEHGFFLVENHQISASFLQHAQDSIYEFFLLPEEEKAKIHISRSPYHRGYFPSGEENAYGSKVVDIKEAFVNPPVGSQ